MKQDLDKAATANVKRDHGDRKGPLPNLVGLEGDTRENFLGHLSLKKDIFRGMASFDPHILLSLPLEQATI